MRPTRFDTRLIQILSAMAAVALIVGIGAIGVNRYLVHSQNRVMADTLPAVELASRVDAAADVADSLRGAVAQSTDPAGLELIAQALTRSLRQIEDGTARLEALRQPPPGTSVVPPANPAPALAPLLAPLIGDARRALSLRAAIDDEAERLAALGLWLEGLVADQTDLARLRITAGISDLYVTPGPPGARPALDELADRHFFAFERLTELGRDIDAIHLALQELPRADGPQVEVLTARLRGALVEARARVMFLPLPDRRAQASAALDQLNAAAAGPGGPGGGPAGLAAMQRHWLLLRDDVERQSQSLRLQTDALVRRAVAARDATQAQGLARIDAQQRLSTRLLLGLLGLIALAVVVAAVLWVYARRRLVGRLAAVSQRIVQVARGDHGAPVAISGHDEIGRMEKALNVLRGRSIQAARLRDSLEHAVIARTGEVVAEMTAANAARAEAEAADRSKSEFLARMGHELHTPLNGLIGMLTLLESDLDDPAARDRARLARSAARDLSDITGDIMHYAGSQGGAGRLNPVHFSLRALVGQLAQQLQGLAAGTGLHTATDLSEGAPPVLLGDVVKIRQVVGNLLSNAVKYTPAGRVTLTVDHAPDPLSGEPVLSFTVLDTGIGMDAAMVARACDSYARADTALREGIGGLGLGLAISRNLTQALGGALTVESQPGLGSRVTLTVPLRSGDPALIADDDTLAPSRAGPEGDSAGGGRDGQSGERDAGALVLVVDDHPVNRLVARGYLEKLGCRVTEAETGSAGIAAAADTPFALALVDLDLPDLEGAEVARQIGALSPAPLLAALTAFPVADTPANRAALNVARILHKPLSPRDLAALLAGLAVATPAGDPGGADAAAPGERADDVAAALAGDVADLGAGVVAEIVTALLADLAAAPQAMSAARGATDADIAAAQRKIAHRLKGAAANLRLDRLCDMLAALEAQHAPLAPDQHAALRAATARASAQLRAAAAQTGVALPAAVEGAEATGAGSTN